MNCTAAHSKHQKFRTASTTSKTQANKLQHGAAKNALLRKSKMLPNKSMLQKNVLLQTKPQTNRTNPHEMQAEYSIAHCNNVKLPCTMLQIANNLRKCDMLFKAAANIAKANLIACHIVVHHISDTATLRHRKLRTQRDALIHNTSLKNHVSRTPALSNKDKSSPRTK